MRFTTGGAVRIPKILFPAGGDAQTWIYESIENTSNIMRFWNRASSKNTPIIAFGCDNDANILLVYSTLIEARQPIRCNTLNSNGDFDVVFQRNGTEYFKLDGANQILNVENSIGLSSSNVYGNNIRPRSNNTDMVFYGWDTNGTTQVEIMRYDYSAEAFDFNKAIDNTGLPVVGNITDTTVSDERLKTNIKEVEKECLECVRNVKVKTFDYKSYKYEKNDTFGFIAQALQKELPEEFKNIVKENKEKHSEESYLSINYMKLSVVLWKCNQEMMKKIEHLEASMYEMMEEVKELKGKGKAQPKAKSKTKNENID